MMASGASLPVILRSEGRIAWLPFSPDDGRVGPSYFLPRQERRDLHISLRRDREAA